MYKSFPSFPIPWFKRRLASLPLAATEVPTSFTMPVQTKSGQGAKLLNVSMNDLEDAFVDISCRQLLYAEAARLAEGGSEGGVGGRVGRVSAAPSGGATGSSKAAAGKRVSVNSAHKKASGDDDEDELALSVVYAEKLKSDTAYRNKHKNKKRRK